LGRTIGFPTANIEVAGPTPAPGIYAAYVKPRMGAPKGLATSGADRRSTAKVTFSKFTSWNSPTTFMD